MIFTPIGPGIYSIPGLSAEDKSKLFDQICKFIKGGFKKFNKDVYESLRNIFGHIAHFDQNGFYEVWFSTPERQLSWVEYVLSQDVVMEYHDGSQRRRAEFTLCDVEKALQDWLRDNVLETVRKAAAAQVEERERAELARLQAKYSACPATETVKDPDHEDWMD